MNLNHFNMITDGAWRAVQASISKGAARAELIRLVVAEGADKKDAIKRAPNGRISSRAMFRTEAERLLRRCGKITPPEFHPYHPNRARPSAEEMNAGPREWTQVGETASTNGAVLVWDCPIASLPAAYKRDSMGRTIPAADAAKYQPSSPDKLTLVKPVGVSEPHLVHSVALVRLADPKGFYLYLQEPFLRWFYNRAKTTDLTLRSDNARTSQGTPVIHVYHGDKLLGCIATYGVLGNAALPTSDKE